MSDVEHLIPPTHELVRAMEVSSNGVLVLTGSPTACSSWVHQATTHAVEALGVEPDEVRLAAATTDRWTVADVTSLVVAPATTTPSGPAWVVVVADAAAMDQAAAARLLKTFEEPPSPAWYVLCIDRDDLLPPALQGRVMTTLTLPSHGDPLEDAASLVQAVDELAAVKRLPPSGTNALTASTRWGKAVRELAGRLRPRPAGPWVRRIARAALDDAASAVSAALAAGADPAACDRAAREIVTARSRIGRYVPIESAMAPAIDAMSHLDHRPPPVRLCV